MNNLFDHNRNSIYRLSRVPRITVDGRGFVRVAGVKIARYIPERHALEFKDHHKGGRIVEVCIDDLAGLKA